MTRLIRLLFVATALVVSLPAVAPAQDWQDQRDQRAAERARRDQERWERRISRQNDDNGAHILFGQSYNLAEGSTTSESVVVVGGDATIDGHAEDDVLVVGGTLKLGPKAVVDGNISLVGGELDRDPAAQVAGNVDVTHISLPSWSWAAWGWPGVDLDRFWWQSAALAFTVGRFFLILILSMLVISLAPGWTAAIAGRITSGPVVSGIVGLAAEIFFAPALVILVVALIITIVGIPLLAGIPFLMAAFALAWVAGYAVVAALLGARLRGSDWYHDGLGAGDVFLGSCMLSGVTLIGQALMVGPGWMAPFATLVRGTGWSIEYIAWTIGLGAVLMVLARDRGFDTGSLPPVVPPLPTPSPTAM